MKIKIKPNIANKYSTDYAEKIRQLESKWVDVETEHLFPDQFNTTSPIKGVSAIGLRIYAIDVDEIQNDERIGRSRCIYCGRWTDTGKLCPNCEKGTDYMEEFFPGTNRESNMAKEISNVINGIIG